MSTETSARRLLLAGALPRLAIALAIVGLLWLGFAWAITPPGGR